MKPANISVIAVLLMCSVAAIARPPRAVMEDGRPCRDENPGDVTGGLLQLPRLQDGGCRHRLAPPARSLYQAG